MSFYTYPASYSNPTSEIIYNEQKWYIHILLYTQTTPSEFVTLQNTKIISIRIIDQMGLYGQHIQIIYSDTDINASQTQPVVKPLTEMFFPNNTFLSVNIKQPPLLSKNNNQIRYHGDFIVSEIQLLSNDTKSIIYKISGVHVNYLTLIQNISYATDKLNDKKINAFDIIADILTNKKVGYPFAQIEQNKYRGRQIDFITYKNMRIIQVIQYCLAVSIHNTDNNYNKIYFFIHNMLQNKAYLISQSYEYQFMKNPINMNLNILRKKIGGFKQYCYYVI